MFSRWYSKIISVKLPWEEAALGLKNFYPYFELQ